MLLRPTPELPLRKAERVVSVPKNGRLHKIEEKLKAWEYGIQLNIFGNE